MMNSDALTKTNGHMEVFIGIDDTDTLESDFGTGKLARWLADSLPGGCFVRGVVRQQLLKAPSIPFTSHNSAACVIVDALRSVALNQIIESTVAHVERLAVKGSDPGICVVEAQMAARTDLAAFGLRCTREKVCQKQAGQAAGFAHLSGHGGTNDGVIGAAAAVGLTASGWSGRFVEFGGLRDFPERVQIAAVLARCIEVVSIDRDGRVPAPRDWLITHQWLRPRLMGGRPVLLVQPTGEGMWEHIGRKRRREDGAAQDG